MEDLKSVLQAAGYKVEDYGAAYRMNAIYRGGQNKMALVVFKNSGKFHDFVSGEKGTLVQLIEKTLKVDKSAAESYVKGVDFSTVETREDEKIKAEKIYPASTLDTMIPDHRYWKGRGLNTETLKTFDVGLFHSGKLSMRSSAPIYNMSGKIHGFWGRLIIDNKDNKYKDVSKYKIIGPRNSFLYPFHLNREIIREEKEIFLVESPADVMFSWQCGVRNVACLFGISISKKMICALSSFQLNKIYISLNNEPDNKSHGNNAAVKVRDKLLKYFDKQTVKIYLPPKKDLMECTEKELLTWYKRRASGSEI